MENQELLEEIEKMPVIDTHEHFDSYTDTFGYNMPRYLYCSCYANIFSGYLPPELVQLLDTPDAEEYSQFEALLQIREPLKYTQCDYLLGDICKRIGIELKKDNYKALHDWYAARSYETVASQNPEIQAYICNSIGHPMFGGLAGLKKYLDENKPTEDKIYRILNITDFHCVHDNRQLQEIGKLADMEIVTLKDWENAVAAVIKKFTEQGIVGFKELYLYFRPLELKLPNEERAVVEFERLQKGEKAGTALLDYMMFRVYQIISEYHLPVAVHTGCTITTGESALHFSDYIKIMQSQPRISFDLLHLNYPMLESYLTILKSCPNAYGNCTWITSVDRDYTKQYMANALDNLPAGQTSFFGGDRHCAGEPVGAVLNQTRQVLADGLDEMIRKHYISRTDALEIARMWLYENPKKLYQINMR